MGTVVETARGAAEALRGIAESEGGSRGLRASAGALVLRAVAAYLAGSSGVEFLVRRALRELRSLPRGPERSALRRLLELVEAGGEGSDPLVPLSGILVAYAWELEKTARYSEAAAALELARAVVPGDPEIALHAGRVARKRGDRSGALSMYALARELDAPCGRFTRLVEIGEALLSADVERELGRAVRRAVVAGDLEAAAVGLEERARVRRESGDRSGAVRDLCVAAARYVDPVDRVRVVHALADVAVSAGDALAAREALLVASELGDSSQRAHARSRLYGLARAMGDEVGMRRWRTARGAGLVSLGFFRAGDSRSSMAPKLVRWRGRLERRAGRGSPNPDFGVYPVMEHVNPVTEAGSRRDG